MKKEWIGYYTASERHNWVRQQRHIFRVVRHTNYSDYVLFRGQKMNVYYRNSCYWIYQVSY